MTKQNQTITVNRLPAKTWNWLKMNETVIGMPRIDGSIAIKQRVAEAAKLGFGTCILPKVCLDVVGKVKGIRLVGVQNVQEALQAIQHR